METFYLDNLKRTVRPTTGGLVGGDAFEGFE